MDNVLKTKRQTWSWREKMKKKEEKGDEADTRDTVKVTDDFITAGCSSECSILYLKWPQLWSISCCARKGFHMLIPIIKEKKGCLSEGLCTFAVAHSSTPSNWGKSPKRFQSVTKNVKKPGYVKIYRRALRWHTGGFFFFSFFLLL